MEQQKSFGEQALIYVTLAKYGIGLALVIAVIAGLIYAYYQFQAWWEKHNPFAAADKAKEKLHNAVDKAKDKLHKAEDKVKTVVKAPIQAIAHPMKSTRTAASKASGFVKKLL